MVETVDAVVIGAGPNGLVASAALADAGEPARHPGAGVHGACGWIAAQTAQTACAPTVASGRNAVAPPEP